MLKLLKKYKLDLSKAPGFVMGIAVAILFIIARHYVAINKSVVVLFLSLNAMAISLQVLYECRMRCAPVYIGVVVGIIIGYLPHLELVIPGILYTVPAAISIAGLEVVLVNSIYDNYL